MVSTLFTLAACASDAEPSKTPDPSRPDVPNGTTSPGQPATGWSETRVEIESPRVVVLPSNGVALVGSQAAAFVPPAGGASKRVVLPNVYPVGAYARGNAVLVPTSAFNLVSVTESGIERTVAGPSAVAGISAAASARDAQGRIVVVGTKEGTTKLSVVRFDAEGNLDGGALDVEIGAVKQLALIDLAFDDDGRLLVLGTRTARTTVDFPLAPWLLRLGADLRIDPSFGDAGQAAFGDLTLTGTPFAVAGRNGGGAVVAVTWSSLTPSKALRRVSFTSAGRRDPAVGVDGVQEDADVTESAANGLERDPRGRTLLFGGFGLVRYTATGERDTTFGTAGEGNTVGTVHAIALAGDESVFAVMSSGTRKTDCEVRKLSP